MRPSYSSNFSQGFLLLNQPIKVWLADYKDPIVIKIPTVQTLLDHPEYSTILDFISSPDKWETNGLFKASDRKQVICGLLYVLKDDIFKTAFTSIFPDLIVDLIDIKCEDKSISLDIFDLITDMLLVGCGYLTYDDFLEENAKQSSDQELSGFMKKQKEMEERIKKIRGEDKKSGGKQFLLNEAFICILSYFQQYTFEDLGQMNYYSIFQLYEWSLKREYQFVNDIAAGNGLMSDKNKYQPLF